MKYFNESWIHGYGLKKSKMGFEVKPLIGLALFIVSLGIRTNPSYKYSSRGRVVDWALIINIGDMVQVWHKWQLQGGAVLARCYG